MKSRTFFSAIAAVAAVLFVMGIAGFWGLTANSPRSLLIKGGQSVPTAAQFVPRQSPLMVSFLVRPDRLWSLRQLLTAPGQRFQAREEWQSLKDGFERWLGWNYDTDLQPWLGDELTLAVTQIDIDHDSGNGQQSGYLAVLSCRDGEQAREAIHLLWQKRAISGKTLVFEGISGISLIYDQAPLTTALELSGTKTTNGINTLASAVVADRFVLLANHPQVLRQAINTFQAPDVSLAKEATYREAIQNLPPRRIGWVYGNLPTLLPWLGLAPSGIALPSETDGYRANHVFASFKAAETGLLIDTAIAAAPGTTFPLRTQTPSAAPSWPQALTFLPPETLAVVAGQHLATALAETDANIGAYSIVGRSLTAFAQTLALPGIVTAPELWQNVEGEYALGLVSAQVPTWLLATRVVDAPPLKPWDDLVQEQGITVSHVALAEQDITVWTKLSLELGNPDEVARLSTQVIGVHTTIRGYEVFATSLAALQQAIQMTDAASLITQPVFATLAESIEASDNAVVYFDWPRLKPLLLGRFPLLRALEQGGQPLTSHLGPLFATGFEGSSSLQQGQLAVRLIGNL
ncbi:MAG: DUF3352 domain-containing protein [Cyanobacteria bacterium J06638_28]